MIRYRAERKLAALIGWFFAACILFVIVSGCSPYAMTPIGVNSPAPSMTATLYQAATIEPTPRPSCTVSTGYEAGRVNLRTGPGTQHAVIDVLQEAQRLDVLRHAGNWILVQTRAGSAGYINGKFCQ